MPLPGCGRVEGVATPSACRTNPLCHMSPGYAALHPELRSRRPCRDSGGEAAWTFSLASSSVRSPHFPSRHRAGITPVSIDWIGRFTAGVRRGLAVPCYSCNRCIPAPCRNLIHWTRNGRTAIDDAHPKRANGLPKWTDGPAKPTDGPTKWTEASAKPTGGPAEPTDGPPKPTDAPSKRVRVAQKPFPGGNGPFPERFRGKRIANNKNTIHKWNIIR